MAPHLLSLLGLMLWIHGTASLCDVSCFTDYRTLVNCSCSSPETTYPVLLQVTCRDEDEGEEAVGQCEITPPLSWCHMHLDELDFVASVGTMCTTTSTSQPDGEGKMAANQTRSWQLSDVVMAPPPFAVMVTDSDDSYNISWSSSSPYRLSYRLRIRDGRSVLKEQSVDETHFLLDHSELPPRSSYSADVQARMNGSPLHGPWSEWSGATWWRGTGSPEEDQDQGFSPNWWLIFLPVILVVMFLLTPVILQLLGYIPPPRWSKTLSAAWRKHTPTPDDFFTPLYQNHGGNFKEWAKPVFTEYDFLRISSSVGQKHHDVLHWNNEKKSFIEDSSDPSGISDTPLIQDGGGVGGGDDGGGGGGSSAGTMGHISIHTVTLSGEEFEDDGTSRSSMISYQDGVQDGVQNHHHHQVSLEDLHLHLEEQDHIFLESFVSQEQSEDGYPHVDLDTIDSGFGECGSPGGSSNATSPQTDLFNQHEDKNSNYVKQWMVCRNEEEEEEEEETRTMRNQNL